MTVVVAVGLSPIVCMWVLVQACADEAVACNKRELWTHSIHRGFPIRNAFCWKLFSTVLKMMIVIESNVNLS